MNDLGYLSFIDLPEVRVVVEHLFWFGLFIALFILYIIRRKKYAGWLRPLGRELPFILMIKEAFRLTFSRWWLIAIPIGLPFALHFSSIYIDKFLVTLGSRSFGKLMKIYPGTDLIIDHLATEPLNVHRLDFLIPYTRAIINALRSPLSVWIFSETDLSILVIAAFAALVWFEYAQRGRRDSAIYNSRAIWVFRIALFYFIISFGVERMLIFGLSGSEAVELRDYILIVLYYLTNWAIIFGYAAIFSVWFGMMYQVVIYRRNSGDFVESENDDHDAQPSKLLDLALLVFPSIVVLEIAQNILQAITLHDGTDFSFPLWRILRYLAVLAVWSCFPLTFVMARESLKLREGFVRLYEIWCHHFRKLMTLALLVIAINIPANLTHQLFYQWGDQNYNDFFRNLFSNPLSTPLLIMNLISTIKIFAQIFSFLLIAVVFQYGEFDLSPDEEIESPQEPKDREPLGGDEQA